MQLSDRQQAIIDFVDSHMELHGYPPTVREICTGVGLNSPSTVHAHLGRLERMGLLRRDPSKPRALVTVGREAPAAVAAVPADDHAGVRVLPLLGRSQPARRSWPRSTSRTASRCPRC